MIRVRTNNKKLSPPRSPIMTPIIMAVSVLACWGSWIASHSESLNLVTDYLQYSLLGILGAVFANATGAGGGVIFIPVFNHLDFSPQQSIATSFAIQCFGMTAGALSWWAYSKKARRLDSSWSQLPKLICLYSPLSIAGLWTTIGLEIAPPSSFEHSFSLFSIFLGLAIIFSHYHPQNSRTGEALTPSELVVLAVITYMGGIVTAWLSVGVGEIVVIYLLLRRVTPTLAVATGVIITALTVWSTSFIHFAENSDAYFNVVMFAGPGAIFGGFIAAKLAVRIPVKGLKLFFSAWIILSGISMLIIQ